MNVSFMQSVWWIYSGRRNTTQQSNILIWYDWYRGHDVWILGGAEEEVIGGMAGHFTRKFVKEWGATRHTIKKDTMDAAVAYATSKTMPAAVIHNINIESI
jgi:hypothetical protein